ncbi:putative flippase GtrA [Pseudochelatococcus lubricantis]|uniref:Flippase GtrA n=1 Tax=Pseudochelatococcus lubricantis TaxID=1538102 RepID=A0ABX0V4N9_9HYPH|nr:GtrA family protein [Pseudochelatococcus lubricantis]NIJ58056.1 putative flippase GtrA [Pseudochelatococcus lubricantis]
MRTLVERLLRHRFVRFCAVGGVATLVHAAVFFLVVAAGGSQLAGNCLGYFVASIWSYYINCLWTFAAALSWQGFVRFQIANSVVLVWGVIAALIGERFAFPPAATLALTVIVGPVLNYLGHSRLTFRKA